MKKLILLLLFIPLVSCQDVEVRKTYYDSGELESTVNYVDDLRQGEYKEYYESGTLRSIVNYVDDLRQGEYKNYYESGTLRSIVNYVDDLRQGEKKYYYESGGLIVFDRKKLIKTFHDNGQLKMEGVYADIDSLEFLLGKVIWQGNGGYYVGVTFEGGYFDDEKKMQITGIEAYRKVTEKPIKDDKWTYYYESGKIEKEEFYEVNLILKTIYYSEKGFKTSKIEYGLKEGWLLAGETKYYENGTIKSEDFDGYEGSYSAKYYENGLMEWEDFGDGEIKTYYENGKKKHSLIDGLEEYYYKNGQIKKTIEIGDDYKLIEEYSEIGKLTKEEIYLSNNLQKEFKEGIWMNGILIFEKDYQLNPSKDERFRYYKKKLLK